MAGQTRLFAWGYDIILYVERMIRKAIEHKFKI